MSYQKVAAAGAKLKCTLGSTESMLLPTRASTVSVENKFLATILDAQPIKNIPPFGVCSVTGGPCMPLLSTPWLGSVGLPLGVNAPMLPADSRLPCAVGGQIIIADCMQNTVMIATVPQPQVSQPELSPRTEDGDEGGFSLKGALGAAGSAAWDELSELPSRARDAARAAGRAVVKHGPSTAGRVAGGAAGAVLGPLIFPDSTSENDIITEARRRRRHQDEPEIDQDSKKPTKVPRPDVKGKEAADDVPDWVPKAKYKPYVGENGNNFADRVMNDRYGRGNYPKGPNTEHGKTKKWADRKWKDPDKD